MSYGFTFKGLDSTDYDLFISTPSRVIKPALRNWEYVVPGRSGTIEYEPDDAIYEKFSLPVPIIYTASSIANLNTVRRNIGSFLSGSGELIFGDDTDKYYLAKVIEAPTPEEILTTGRAEVIFECQPFARSNTLTEQTSSAGVSLPHTETVTVSGTADTPCIIYITAGTTITDLTIERKVQT